MVYRKGLVFLGLAVLLILSLTGSIWASNRAIRSLDPVYAFNSRINRGHKLFSLGSPGGRNDGGNAPVPVFESASTGIVSTPASNGSGGNSSIPLNLSLYLNLIGVAIDGQDVSQGNGLDSTQLALLSQNATANLLALNIATIIQNNIQIGLNLNVSPIINVVIANGVDVPVNVNVETPDVSVGPIDIQVGGV
ncbi:MAG: hypothetical protein ABDK94_02345 [Atribacterota bacterium]